MILNFDKKEYLYQLYHSRFTDSREGVDTSFSMLLQIRNSDDRIDVKCGNYLTKGMM